MEFFFNDPNIQRLPPEETRLVNLRADPSPDGKRLRVTLELTPFQRKPYIELVLADGSGKEMTSASIVEPNGWKLELTLHIRKSTADIKSETDKSGNCTLTAVLSYPDLGEIDRRQIPVECLIVS